MVLILGGLVLIVVGFLAKKGNPMFHRFSNYLKLGGLTLLLVGCFISTVRIIQPGRVGVQSLLGEVLNTPIYSGLNIVNPLIKVDEFDITLQTFTMSDVETETNIKTGTIHTLSSDGLEVIIDMTVSYRLDAEKLIMLRKDIGTDNAYVEKIIKPNARTRIRESASQYTAVEIYSIKRDNFQRDVYMAIKNDFLRNGINLENVLIRNINLPESVKAAIEAKINAEQEAQKMEFVLRKEEQEAERKRVEARGIADYQKIINSTLTDKQLKYESIKAIENISKSQNSKVVLIGDGKSPSILIGN